MTATITPVRAPQRAVSARAAAVPDLDGTTGPGTGTQDLVPRFWNLLLPAVTAAIGQFAPSVAPQIGGAIGGLFGGQQGSQAGTQIGGQVGGFLGSLFGGRDLGGFAGDTAAVDREINRALDQFQLVEVTTDILQRITPEIIDAMRQEVQSRAARGETGDLDDESLERGWGFLASLVTDLVIKYAPDAIKKATKAIGAVVSGREVDTFTPLMVDTETTQRFVLPSMCAIQTGVQVCMPQLFSLLTTNRDIPRDAGISWSDLEQTKRLWDNDNIAVVGLTPIAEQDQIEIVLELAAHKTWWKGIQVQDDNGSVISEIGVQDRNKVASVRVTAQQILDPGGYLLFMKAKFFGIHTGMYRLATGGLNQLRGQRVHFYWYAD